ncbi:MAG: hypothetical protein E5W78_08785 [Mesorhizobium sp.]|nr:hypothetical protein EOC94_25730 [Mesorhizobium sp. M6A.T.Ce.TU.016.01.1.1]RWN29280.1 MAG: hypothetical protein EOR95_21985 [Mesorhizobium sp.]TIT37121.1 MAG: hypothetical protein E5W78_08785 [Mesorhizobium sp.]TIU16259.1 MAG: hypothetical protein E5W40_00250 [Mesorhizobium sp.]
MAIRRQCVVALGVALLISCAHAQQACDPNYTGSCVPIASDVDCSSGSGNGPAYVSGPVNVVGADIYNLDRDHDGIGCENG